MQGNLKMSSSPHIRDKNTVRGIMADVIIALIPAVLAGTLLYGIYSLFLILLCVGSCVLFEYTYNLIAKSKNTVKDLSAVVTGILLGLNIPPRVPIYIPIIGSLFAIAIVKMLFGGLGKNFANPAVAARIFLVLSFGKVMTHFSDPISYGGGFFEGFFGSLQADAVSSATPLSGGKESLLDMFLGKTGGCIGETSTLALLIGGIYLSVKKVIDFRVPLIIIFTVAVFSFIFSGDIAIVLPSILGGGLFIGSIFMATDYATSPNSTIGLMLYAFIIGLLTILIRHFSAMPEGISYAILLGNLITPLIDKYVYPAHFGQRRNKRNG